MTSDPYVLKSRVFIDVVQDQMVMSENLENLRYQR
jgi:hypothetical protein